MFFPWSPFALALFFFFMDLMITLSFGAILAHISRKFEGYAHSIRWIQQAGKWEMISALYCSRGMKSRVPRLALFATFLASLVLTAIPLGAKSFVKEAVVKGSPSQELVSSRQIIAGSLVSTLSGWTFSVPYDISVKEALEMGTGSTKAIPWGTSVKHYRPTVSEYKLVCERFNFKMPDNSSIVLPIDDCATVILRPTVIDNFVNISRMYTVHGSKGQVKVVIPARRLPEKRQRIPDLVEDMGVFPRVNYLDNVCLTFISPSGLLNTSYAGITSTPTTTLTKCLVPNGDSIIVSTSFIRFIVPSNDMFHSVATSIFGTQNELVKGMQASVDNTTLTTLPGDELEELVIIEAEVIDTEAVALICSWFRHSVAETPSILCLYTITNVLVINPSPMNPNIARLLVNKGLNPSWTNFTTTVVLSHLPRVSRNATSFNIPKIIDESRDVTRYFASLGNNFIVDWEGSVLHIIYDTVETLKGYELPLWLFVSIIVITTVCFLFWITTKRLVDERYRRSFYMTVSCELLGNTNDVKPRLHEFNPKILEFDGRHRLVTPILSSQPSRESVSFHDLPSAGSKDHLTAC